MNALEVRDLHLRIGDIDSGVDVVSGVTFSLQAGRTVGLVGESGSGKTLTSLAIIGVLPPAVTRIAGEIVLEGRDLTRLDEEAMADLRGATVSMIFQEPMSSLNPAYRIGHQIAWVARRHLGLSRAEATVRAVEMLDRVGIPRAAERAHAFPHEFSGGMRQRVMIAMALVCHPRVLIADEPTSALDVTTQAAILDLIRGLAQEMEMATVFTTHDMGVVADVCDEVVVMYAGQVVERRPVEPLFADPRHPYTRGLLGSIPRRGQAVQALKGSVPSPADYPAGCRFGPRCSTFSADLCDRPIAEHPVESGWARCVRLDLTTRPRLEKGAVP